MLQNSPTSIYKFKICPGFIPLKGERGGGREGRNREGGRRGKYAS